jgi:hypothetical protein
MPPFADRLDREVAATADEFVRALHAAFPDRVSGGPARYHIVAFGAALDIDVAVAPERRIASLVLPTLQVRLSFAGGDAGQRRALLEHLDRATQRGGG